MTLGAGAPCALAVMVTNDDRIDEDALRGGGVDADEHCADDDGVSATMR